MAVGRLGNPCPESCLLPFYCRLGVRGGTLRVYVHHRNLAADSRQPDPSQLLMCQSVVKVPKSCFGVQRHVISQFSLFRLRGRQMQRGMHEVLRFCSSDAI